MARRDSTVHTMPDDPAVPTPAAPDRLSLLPNELLDAIYALVLHSGPGPCTLHLNTRSSDAEIPALLALPSERQYRALRTQASRQIWPDEVERAFFRGLEWAYRYTRQRLNEVIVMIIYELTGARRSRKQVSSHLQLLKGCWDQIQSRKLPQRAVCDAVDKLQACGDREVVRETIEELVLGTLPRLSEAFETEEMVGLVGKPVPERPAVGFAGVRAVTAHAESFRWMSELVSKEVEEGGLGVRITGATKRENLGLTLVNRFHRTGTLTALAADLVFDFADDVEMMFRLQLPVPMRVSIKRMRLLFMEGYMDLGFAESLASGGAISVLPNLRELFVELWPRNPRRQIDAVDMTWGEQTVRLLEVLTGWTGRVVVEWRWKRDCERFEGEYVG